MDGFYLYLIDKICLNWIECIFIDFFLKCPFVQNKDIIIIRIYLCGNQTYSQKNVTFLVSYNKCASTLHIAQVPTMLV